MKLLFIIIVAAVLALDLITKFTIPGILNPGVAWGLGADLPWLWYVVVAGALVIAGALIWWFYATKPRSAWLTVGLALFVGGILGNAIDRLVTGGAVHDFIDFVIFKNNIADLAIFVGAVLVGVKVAFR